MQDKKMNNSTLRQSILELRTKLFDVEITPKGYRKEIDKLLTGVGDDIRIRFSELEHAFDSEEITQAEYEQRLAEVFQDENEENQVAGRPDDAFDVFLSYSHKDANEYDAALITRIKTEIEKSLEGIVSNPRVFLDTDALSLGDAWHSKIMESLKQCLAFVCLVSENYLKSGYSERERIWWKAKQTQDGRLLDGLYPVYYIKLSKELFAADQSDVVKDLVSIQTETQPWFEFKKSLQEDFIRERLKVVTGVVKQKVQAALKASNSFCTVTPPLCKTFVGRITELRELHDMCANGK